jgi:hypothetical protein
MRTLVHEFVDNYCDFDKNAFVECNIMNAALDHYLSDVRLLPMSHKGGYWIPEFMFIFEELMKDVCDAGKDRYNRSVVLSGVRLTRFPHKDHVNELKLKSI